MAQTGYCLWIKGGGKIYSGSCGLWTDMSHLSQPPAGDNKCGPNKYKVPTQMAHTPLAERPQVQFHHSFKNSKFISLLNEDFLHTISDTLRYFCSKT